MIVYIVIPDINSGRMDFTHWLNLYHDSYFDLWKNFPHLFEDTKIPIQKQEEY